METQNFTMGKPRERPVSGTGVHINITRLKSQQTYDLMHGSGLKPSLLENIILKNISKVSYSEQRFIKTTLPQQAD